MKKLILIISLLFVLLTGLGALPSFVYAPYSGFAGIPIGNIHYKGGSTWASSGGEDSDDTYANAEMLALVSLYPIDSTYFNKSFTVSVTCPNGMYMVSMSQPTFKRPFEIYLYPVAKNATLTDRNPIKLSNSNPIAVYTPGFTGTSTEKNVGFWFDVVLVLPVDEDTSERKGMDTENDRLVVDGNVYPLARTNDYSAIVTISIDFEGASDPISFTMPFTGYYNGSPNPHNSAAALPVALDINVYPEATNISLDIANRGKWIDIGHLVFLLNSTKDASIFLSSSSDPFVAGDEFRLEKDDLSHTAQLTSVNSIGFTARLTDTNGNVNLFEGNEFISPTASYDSSVPDNFVKLETVTTAKFNNENHGNVSYKEYQAEVSIMLDSVDTTLLSGRYEEEIYCHVLIF